MTSEPRPLINSELPTWLASRALDPIIGFGSRNSSHRSAGSDGRLRRVSRGRRFEGLARDQRTPGHTTEFGGVGAGPLLL
jgi:hypothetical protein